MRSALTLAVATIACLVLSPLALANETLFLDPRALAALDRFEATWARTKSATYRVVKTERMRDGDVIKEEIAIKFLRPGRAYIRMIHPIKGREIIYDPTKDRKKLIVHNGQFPDLTLTLDIHGGLATRNQHHSVEHLGFDQALRIFRGALAIARREPHDERLEYHGQGTFAGRPVEKVVMLTGKRPLQHEVAREDESLFEFAERVAADAYSIYRMNPSIRSLSSDLDPGEMYTIPAYYVDRCESWHDKETGMPLKQVIWVGGKLYESYENLDLVLDAPLTEADFDSHNRAYGF